MLQNAYFLAKIGADTAENEQHFAEILPKTGNAPRHERLRQRQDECMHLVDNPDSRLPMCFMFFLTVF